jgi:hypothetical protein
MDEKRRAFYEYHAAMMEPWDGPAAMAFTDGRQIGATLDRNGLRPARYVVTDDDLVMMASEAGVLPIPKRRSSRSGVCSPARCSSSTWSRVASSTTRNSRKRSPPPSRTVRLDRAHHRVKLDDLSSAPTRWRPRAGAHARSPAGLRLHAGRRQVHPVCADGEWRGSHRLDGQRLPLAVLSIEEQDALPTTSSKLFAQVTNPPIDPIREELVMSLVSFIGPRPNLLGIDETNPPLRLEVSQPVLDFEQMEKIRHIARYTDEQVPLVRTGHLLSRPPGARKRSRRAWHRCAPKPKTPCARAGSNILIVSDRKVDAEHVAIPALLALSAIHQHLVNRGCAPRPDWWSRQARRAKCITSRCSVDTAPKPCIPTWPRDAVSSLPRAKLGAGIDKRAKACQELHQGSRQGPAQGHVQDGHLDLHVLHRRADLRGGRSVESRWSRSTSPVPPRTWKASACSKSPKRRSACTSPPSATTRFSRTRWTPVANTPSASVAKSTCGRRMPSPSSSTRRARRQFSTLTRNTRRSSTISPSAHDVSRPVRLPFRPMHAGAARRGRIREGHREAIRHRRDVARLHFDRSAHNARHRDEPHRRQVEHG